MKNHLLTKHLLFTSIFLFITMACQDDQITNEIDLVDEDMIAATNLADEYLISTKGRQSSKKSITVLRFKYGKLYYDTNTDDFSGYREVTEQTVTAFVKPGEFVFWYSGGGISDLDEIEFDEDSQTHLSDYPEEINSDHMWVIRIPENYNMSLEFLKYDIVYMFKGHDGLPIRLDPKIKVNH